MNAEPTKVSKRSGEWDLSVLLASSDRLSPLIPEETENHVAREQFLVDALKWNIRAALV